MQKIVGHQTVPIYAQCCDWCARELAFEKGTEVSATVNFNFGYFTERDGQRGKFVFCQTCAELLYQYLREQSSAIELLDAES